MVGGGVRSVMLSNTLDGRGVGPPPAATGVGETAVSAAALRGRARAARKPTDASESTPAHRSAARAERRAGAGRASTTPP